MKLLLRALMLNIMALSSLQVFAIANPLPEGSYQESCTSCTYDAETKTLDCVCRYGKPDKRGNRQKKATHKSGCERYKVDRSGNLACE